MSPTQTKPAVHIEALFNSVEQALAQRWVIHHVPAHFAARPVEHLRKVVQAWRQIYHESISPGHDSPGHAGPDQLVNPTYWDQKDSSPAEALDTPALLVSLEEIYRLITVGGGVCFRPLRPAEGAAICLLANMAAYYAEPFTDNVR